jgi:hypothetical protein
MALIAEKKLILDYTGLELLRGISHAFDIMHNRCNKGKGKRALLVEDLALAFMQLSSLDVPVYGDAMSGVNGSSGIIPLRGPYNICRRAYQHPSHVKRLALLKKIEQKEERSQLKVDLLQERKKLRQRYKGERSSIAIAAAERRLRIKRAKLN